MPVVVLFIIFVVLLVIAVPVSIPLESHLFFRLCLIRPLLLVPNI